MEESKDESMMYMQRRTEVSLPLLTSKNPMKRHRSGEDSSVAWYNLEKAEPLKEYRDTEFDDPMRKADSPKHFRPMEGIKHGELENAIGNHYYNYATEPTSSKSTNCDSSASDLQDPDSDEGSHPSGFLERKKLKLQTELKTGEYSAFEALVDVPLTAKASRRAEKVPFVCLTSKLNGQAILGYPIEIGELNQDSETLFPRKESAASKLFGDGRRRLHQLSWRTCKRTPVCYVTNLVSKNEHGSKKNVEEQKQFKQGKAAVRRSCVPVEVVFGKILAAVSQVES